MKLQNFKDVKHINLITYKKDGSSVTTPVWIAEYNDSLVVSSELNAGKVKRIRNNGKATIYQTNFTGSKRLSESLDVKGSLIVDKNKKIEAENSIRKKYGMFAKMYLMGSGNNRAIIKLEEKDKQW